MISLVSGHRSKVLAVIPVYGHNEMTHALLGDLATESDLVDTVVVDNLGEYEALGDETVLRPGSNLGWAGGTNFGTEQCRRDEHVGFVWLNNDTRLARGFVAGLLRAWRATGAGLVAPFYDCHWTHQRIDERTPVGQYQPRSAHYRATFVDGTCIFVPASTVEAVGLLDAETFAPLGWGAEIDYCLRVRAARMNVVVTRLAYLHHERSVTAKTVFDGGFDEYLGRAYPVALEGLARKWGADWQEKTGVDPATSQTSVLLPADRIYSGWPVVRSPQFSKMVAKTHAMLFKRAQ
jgi:GT2 family glycosyltransferase